MMMRFLKVLVIIVVLFFTGTPWAVAGEGADSVAGPERNWLRQLFENGFNLNDPAINYPRFPRFCVDVYNWGDRTFNSYDKDYVVSTGKNWKVMAKTYNWSESYFLDLENKSRVLMISDMYSDLGVSINFMALSLGYTFNANNIFGSPVAKRRIFDFSFTCALFSGNVHSSSTHGGVSIRRFAKYKDGHSINVGLDDVKQTRLNGNVFYFFNHRKYSHAAAYSYSKYQLRSAGSWVLGVSLIRTDIDIDFSSLPPDMLDALPPHAPRHYSLNYNDYCLLGGYAYNWVLHPRRWLINITALPSVGVKHLRNVSVDDKKDLFAANIKVNFSVVYNYKALFAAFTGQLDAEQYTTNNYSFLNGQESLSICVGARF
ncbi:DUF4421 domain-containing protein [uncultured Muribaculum sp.]|uniref:DUF4421 domain-containing protein n=2 Tax=uncultured Muribaculum sp. TaxID=1918613 RepID=UPI00262365DE|nr:DUF4421 domain-containing protein [uncultured Muribaculum sp.]